jgi:hypothetical protein
VTHPSIHPSVPSSKLWVVKNKFMKNHMKWMVCVSSNHTFEETQNKAVPTNPSKVPENPIARHLAEVVNNITF